MSITLTYCWEKDGPECHGWYVDECPKCQEGRIDRLKADKDKCIAELEGQIEKLNKLLAQTQREESESAVDDYKAGDYDPPV